MNGPLMKTASEQDRKTTQPLPAPRAGRRADPWTAGEKRLLLCAAASAVLLYLCYFPVGWGWLGWVALVPLLFLVRGEGRPRRLYLCAWVAGIGFYLPVLQWMRVADPRMYFTWIGLALYCSLYFPLAVFLVRVLDRRTRLPLLVTLPAVWTALEYLRENFGGGFGWYLLGYTQHRFDAIIQISDIAGVYGVSFLVAAVNVVLFEWVSRVGPVRRWVGLPLVVVGSPDPTTPADRGSPLVGRETCGRRQWPGQETRPQRGQETRPQRGVGLPGGPSTNRPALVFRSAAVLLTFAACFLYGSRRIGQADFAPGPRVALVQSNVPQQVRNNRNSPDAGKRERAVKRMAADDKVLTGLAAAQKPDLVIWPETSFAAEWDTLVGEINDALLPPGLREDVAEVRRWEKKSQELAAEVADATGAPVLLGLNVTEWRVGARARRFNSALLIGADGEPVARYDKMHRVPFGEYVPFRETFAFMDWLAPYDFDYSITAGAEQTRLPLGAYRFGVVICYEDTDPDLAREYVNPANGVKADFLVNISNDGWFDGTSEHEEHLAICRFRAVEARRAVVRSVNMGISAVIDGNGRVLAPVEVEERDGAMLWDFGPWDGSQPELPVGRWHEFKKVPGVLLATVPLDSRLSLYARWGDWLPIACWAGLGAALLVVWARRRTTTPLAVSRS